MPQTTLLITPMKQVIPAQGGILDVLVRVQAPDQPEGQLIPHSAKRLALVVDRSGSMDGEPLHEALRCVEYIATHLHPTDELAVLVYDDKVDVLSGLAPVGNADAIRKCLAGVSSRGSTDLFAGWLGGASQLEAGAEGKISRVLILSDGQANQGVVDVTEIEAACKQWFDKGVSTTTVGLGHGFNEHLMVAMAQAGGGQQYYGQKAEDLHDAFAEELSLLQSLYARKVDAKLVAAPGVIIEPLGIVKQNADGSYRLSDLAWGAETWIALRLHLSPGAVGELRDLLAVSVQAQDVNGLALTANTAMLQLATVAQAEFLAAPADELAARRVQEVEFGTQSQRLRTLAKRGNKAAVQVLLTDLQTRFGGHAWLAEKLVELRALAEQDLAMMEKEVHFSSIRFSKRLTSKSEIEYSQGVAEEASAPAFLTRKTSEGKGKRPN